MLCSTKMTQLGPHEFPTNGEEYGLAIALIGVVSDVPLVVLLNSFCLCTQEAPRETCHSILLWGSPGGKS